MLVGTRAAIAAILKADTTVDAPTRQRIIRCLDCSDHPHAEPKSSAPAPNRLLRRREVAQRLSRSLRTIDLLCANGILHKVKLRGHSRAAGIPESEVNLLIANGTTTHDAIHPHDPAGQ